MAEGMSVNRILTGADRVPPLTPFAAAVCEEDIVVKEWREDKRVVLFVRERKKLVRGTRRSELVAMRLELKEDQLIEWFKDQVT